MEDLLASIGLKFSEAATIVISCVALILSWRTATSSSKLSRDQHDASTRQKEAEAKIAALHTEVTHEQTRLQRDTDIIRWAGEAVGLLAEMAELPVTEMEEDTRLRRWHALRHKLSTQIDIGRFYFPNYGKDIYGQENPTAFRGRRQRVLEFLVEAYDVFDEEDVTGDLTTRRACKKALVAERQNFISEVQRFIDPSRYVEFRDGEAIEKLKREVETAKDTASSPDA